MTNYKNAKGWLTENEREHLYMLAKSVRPQGVILNVGVEYGASVWCLAEGAPSATIFCLDVDLSRAEWPPHRSLVKITKSSFITVHTWATQLDLAFIDGDHSLKGIQNDIGFAQYIRPGGYIAFHDCYAWEGGPHKTCPEVNQAVTEWAAKTQWPELSTVDSIRIFQCKS